MTIQQPLLNLALRDEQGFESFFPSAKNQLLLTEMKTAISSANHQQLFIWGAAETGKSHLLQASCHTAHRENIATAYMPLSDLKRHGSGVFQGSLHYQLICIDDVHTVLGHEDWETALFNLINQARDAQQVLIFSANENPRHLQCKLADLHSRLLWGGSYQLHELDDNEKTEAIRFRAAQRGIELDNTVIEYIYKRYPRDFTTLIEILDKLDKESLSSQRKITIPLVKQALESAD